MTAINWTELRDFIVRLFAAAGLKESEASIAAEILVDAELNGVSTHGVSMVPAHIRKMQRSYDINAELTVEQESFAFAVLNANNMMGILSAYQAMLIAIDKARKSGISLVLCNHANTFSAASYYVEMAVKAGMVGIAMCNAPAQMAPLGGKEKLLGTNPLAVGIPGKNEEPFIFDMATSVVAKSKINEAIRRGEAEIPYGWATDGDGQPTNDPRVAVKGLILPMAGAKGYGLCMTIDLVAGLLSGAASMDEVGRFFPIENGCMNVGHAFIVIDPTMLHGQEFFEKVDNYLHRIRTSKSAGEMPILVPGDINRMMRQRMMTEGIRVDDKTLAEMKALAEQLDVSDIPEGIAGGEAK